MGCGGPPSSAHPTHHPLYALNCALVKPEKMTRPIYKEVLHADLDDPYLGLGEVLFAKYLFAKEDAAH